MRKALQDEQQRADKMLRQGSLQKQVDELDEQISDLKQAIWDRLEDEKRQKEHSTEVHEQKKQEEWTNIKNFQK